MLEPSHPPDPASDAEARRLDPRTLRLVALLTVVSMFEGFDIAATSVVMPFATRDFHATAAQFGGALSVVSFGAIAALGLIRLADRFGRRPMLLTATAGFGLCSLQTVLAPTLAGYAAIQLVARLLLVSQISLAYLILSETLPPARRGRWNGVLGASGSFGAALPFLIIHWAVDSSLGWRAIFLVGALPLLAVPLLARWLPETPAFVSGRAAGARPLTARQELTELLGPRLRRRFIAMAALWLVLNFASGISSLFFTGYVVQERGWSAGDLTRIAPGVMAGAFLGYLLSGGLMDLLGRRATVTLFVLMICGFTALCYASSSATLITVGWIGVQATLGVWTAAFTLNAELFPTHLRAAANGWCNNLLGRWGAVAAPAVLAAAAQSLGSISAAAQLLGLAVLTAIPLVWLALPETRAANLRSAP